MSVSWTTSKLPVSMPTSERLQSRTRGNYARRWNKERKWIAVEKVRAGPRRAVVRPDVTERPKERIAQSKRARGGSLTIVD